MSTKALVKETAERTAAVSFTEINARRRGPIRRYFGAHPRVMDLLVVMVFLLLSVANPIVAAVEQRLWWAVPAVLAAAALLMFRRDAPVIVLAGLSLGELLMIYFSNGVASVSAGIWFALYCIAARYPARGALGLMVLAAIPSLGGLWLVPEAVFGTEPWLVFVVAGFILLTYFIAVGIGVTVRRDRFHEKELADWAERHEKLASANERNRIAREMHDVVAHSLSVMIALSDGAAVVMKRNPDRAFEVLAELSSTGRTALADMRRVLGVLRSGSEVPLEPLPATSSLTSLLEGFRIAGLPIKLVVTGPGLPAQQAFQLTVYRIVQESLTNVLRYGKGVTTVEVLLERRGNRVRIRVSDDGRGSMDPVESIGSGQGIKGIRERAAIYSGTVDCGPGTQGGWIVNVELMAPEEKE